MNAICKYKSDSSLAMHHLQIIKYGKKIPYDTKVYCYYAFEKAYAENKKKHLITGECVDKIKTEANLQIKIATNSLRGK